MTETVVTARRERGRKEGSSVYLASDASSCQKSKDNVL